jgi:CobQ/CobB/MinD/ParA family nucleotide binding protein
MLIFATSDKGGTGRSVTSSNLLYRSALQGNDVCYVDFDFGSPTAGAIFGVENAENGTTTGRGTHRYLDQHVQSPEHIDVWSHTDRSAVRHRPSGAGRLVLIPGDYGGSDFTGRKDLNLERCVDLFLTLNAEFGLSIIDLSAGRNLAVEMALKATARPELRSVQSRWLVFHRWTRQHVAAAGGLVHGTNGLLATATRYGHDPEAFLLDGLRFVRTAVIDQTSPSHGGLTAQQAIWLRQCDERLRALADKHRVGKDFHLGSVPLDPMLQWQEQLITDDDVASGVANRETRDAFDSLARLIADDLAWETL